MKYSIIFFCIILCSCEHTLDHRVQIVKDESKEAKKICIESCRNKYNQNIATVESNSDGTFICNCWDDSNVSH